MVDSEFCGTITGLDLTQCAVLCAFFFPSTVAKGCILRTEE